MVVNYFNIWQLISSERVQIDVRINAQIIVYSMQSYPVENEGTWNECHHRFKLLPYKENGKPQEINLIFYPVQNKVKFNDNDEVWKEVRCNSIEDFEAICGKFEGLTTKVEVEAICLEVFKY